MFKLVDLICRNPKCSQERIEDLLTERELRDGMPCPRCGETMEVDMTNRPQHGRHLSWSKWRVGLGS